MVQILFLYFGISSSVLFGLSSVAFGQSAADRLRVNQMDPRLIPEPVTLSTFDIVAKNYCCDQTVPSGGWTMLVGRYRDESMRIIHHNDEDLVRFYELAEPVLGVPPDDDIGRTAGLVFNHLTEGEEGSLEIILQNWLYTNRDKVEDPVDENSLIIEEDRNLTILFRRLRGADNEEYFIIGFNATQRTQDPALLIFLQEMVHHAIGDKQWNVINRDESDTFFNGIFGIGGEYNVIDTRRFDVYLIPEITTAVSSDFLDQSYLSLSGTIDFDIGGSRDRKLKPLFVLQLHGERTDYMDFPTSTIVSGRILRDWNVLGVRFDSAFSFTRWTSFFDTFYEGKPSFTTGIEFGIPIGKGSFR